MAKKSGKRVLALTIFIFLLLSLLLYLVSPYLLQKYLHHSLEKQHIQISSIQVSRNFNVTLRNLQLNTSTYHIFIDSLSIKPNLWHSLQALKPIIHAVYIQNLLIKILPQQSTSPSNILESQQNDNDTVKAKSIFYFSKKIYNNIRKILTHLPEKVSIQNCSYYNDSALIGTLTDFHQEDNTYSALLVIQNNSAHVQGSIYPDSQKISFLIFPSNQSLKLTLTNPQLSIEFQELYGTLQMDSILTFSSQWKKLTFFHPKAAEKPISIDSLFTFFRLKVTDSSLFLYPGSIVYLNQWRIYPQLSFIQARDTIFSSYIKTDTINAQQGFQSIPMAFRERLGSMRFTGKWAFDAHFYIYLGSKDSAFIFVKPYLHQFHIRSYGNTPIPMLNDTFTFRPFTAKRLIHVGPRNPYFTPLDQISPYLIHAVRVSEDGSFFRHRGFNVKAIQESLIENLRRGYFARGGSTISMQLIKNVFLTHRKTLARKFQEIFLTWLMEHFHIVPKERILEVYLNIIEWGPDVYGIGEASEFYFKRKPATLTPAEAIFLSMIIPTPRKFYYFFNTENDSLKKSVEYHYKLVGYFLKRDSIITETQYQQLFPPYVFIIGPARQYLPSVKAYLNSITQ